MARREFMALRVRGRWEKANEGGVGIGMGLGSAEDRVRGRDRGRSTEYRVRIIECRL